MKSLKRVLAATLAIVFLTTSPVFAQMGDSGFFGGIVEGRKLPSTIELLLKDKKDSTYQMVYKEVCFLTGQPVTFQGTLKINDNSKDIKDSTDTSGSYKVTYNVDKSDSTDDNIEIKRKITYDVDYRKEDSQIIKNYSLKNTSGKNNNWSETITIKGVVKGEGEDDEANEEIEEQVYKLDPEQSKSSVSIIEDQTPGVDYYKGNLSHRAVYLKDDEKVTVDMNGAFYGYSCAYSSTETYRIDCTVTTPEWQMQYQIRPSVSLGKTLQYTKNEPTAISFEGNYQEVMQNRSGLTYDVYVLPNIFTYSVPTTGSVSIDSFNEFEQLVAPDVSYVKGHFAEDDIRRMFSMQILTGEPRFYQPNQAITRGQFVEMLVRAIKLPVEDPNEKKKSKKKVINVVFPDVLPERSDYTYIMAAYDAGLAVGRDNGHFYADSPIERQEAIVILLRTLGLETLGLEPTSVTTFADDASIASWAKKEIYAANRLGLIAGDEDGKFRPKAFISKAEAAALVNRLNNYMRNDLQTDYTEHIVNFAD